MSFNESNYGPMAVAIRGLAPEDRRRVEEALKEERAEFMEEMRRYAYVYLMVRNLSHGVGQHILAASKPLAK